jgi:hypothetical protein
MSSLLSRLSYDALKFDNGVLAGMLLVWVVVAVCGVHSVLNQPFEQKQRWFWVLLIVCLPVIGLLSYLPFALSKDRPSAYFKRSK